MARTAGAFEAELDRDMDRAKDEIRQARDMLVTEAYSGVVERTPVDTGFARNSWFTEIGDGATMDSNGGTGQPTPAVTLPLAGPFQEVTIANGAEYIDVLENGRSDQAPNGMVAVTIAELESRYRIIR